MPLILSHASGACHTVFRKKYNMLSEKETNTNFGVKSHYCDTQRYPRSLPGSTKMYRFQFPIFKEKN